MTRVTAISQVRAAGEREDVQERIRAGLRARRGEAPVPGGKEGSPAQLDRAAAAEQRATADAAKGGAAQ